MKSDIGHQSGQVHVSMLGALPPWRGVSAYTSQLVQALSTRTDVAVEFLDFKSLYPAMFYPGGDPKDTAQGRPEEIPNVSVRRTLAWYNPLSWIWVGLTFRGSVLHVQWWSYVLAPVYLTLMALARIRGRQVLLTLHNARPHEEGRLQRWANEAVLRLSDHFVVHAEANREALLDVYPAANGRVSVIRHGLLRIEAGQNTSKGEARQRLGLHPDDFVLLAFGNIRPYKGLDVLLRSLRKVLDGGHKARLLIAGEPWGSFDKYDRVIDRLNLRTEVQSYLEYQSDDSIELLFAGADAAVFPYLEFDAQSGAASLALSFGVPMIVSDVGGLTGVVADRRVVVPPDDADALANAIVAVLSDTSLRAKLRRDALEIAGTLDWTTIACRTVDLYGALVGQESTHGVANGADNQVA